MVRYKVNKGFNGMKTSLTKDPMCGMITEPKTALHAERNGETFYFYSEQWKEKSLSTPADAKSEGKSVGCCCD